MDNVSILVLTSVVLEQPEGICVLVSKELTHDQIRVASDKVKVPPVVLVLQPVVPARGVVPLELPRRRVAEEDYLEKISTVQEIYKRIIRLSTRV